ncbi:TetR/AcrR family transcriptional regulator [Pseudobacteriovorax antillogorgiicola]|uniref:Transcriptional regulator, TetR family n=1 Tax=Pseudobacteriovorax antillogorgiicola TaxID=1513793 RepID=A0A1Y6CHG4_9BACT|nr:TetR/AcrR family transcriptional regulator [Pseudobacteriovorax antillogorgiicola]TCS46951.1 TetR family transcriptional regulator [Pseudobacteriovorax antillogorgiicola]SMF64513.1 transcriptional regulator, TetR family [Pseudobacteriovorax antillogorgiicola]
METREKILEAAVEVFGWGPSSSLEAVAKKAGITRMTVSRHFKSKDVLLLEAREYCIDLFQKVIDEAVASQQSSIDKLTQILVNYVPLHSHYIFLIRAVAGEIEDDGNQRLRKQVASVCQITEQAKTDGYIRKDFPTAWVSSFLDFIAIGIGNVKQQGSIAPNETNRIAVESFLYGCSPKNKA